MKKNLVLKENHHEENYLLDKTEMLELLKKKEQELEDGKFDVDSYSVMIPSSPMRIKLKYEVDKNHAINIRISWRKDEKNQ